MEPKFKKGDTVWFTSNWFAGSYIPDTFDVWDVREQDGKFQYRKKRMRTWWDEDKLFATEGECQIHEVERFDNNVRKRVADLLKASQELEVGQEALSILLTGKYEQTRSEKKVFEPGDKVWGHTDEHVAYNEYANPQEYVIAERLVASEDGEKWWTYTLKGHGTLTVPEEYLFSSKEDALLDNASSLRKDSIGVINALKERCGKLKIPTDTISAIAKELFGMDL